MVHILVIDDDPHIRELISLYLKREGYEVSEAPNGKVAMAMLEQTHFDLLILDIMMPEMDGWDFCKDVKSTLDIPILMVTAKGESQHRIKGFELGTDDYLVKPFEPRELVMRAKALLRRFHIFASHVIQFGDLQLDQRKYEITIKNHVVTLPPKEFELLFKLASSPGQIYTREQLIEQIWGIDYQGDERTVDVHIKRLRERLADAEDTCKISTVRGLGYRFEVMS